MNLTYTITPENGALYICQCSYDERETAKKLGFRWEPTLKKWATDDPTVAARAIDQIGADAAARAALADALEARTARATASRAAAADIDIPAPAGMAYRPFQRAGIAYALAAGNTLIADEMGLGKTVQALGVINASPDIHTILIVCPASLVLNWRREAARWIVRDVALSVINYEKLHRREPRPYDLLIVDEAHYCKNPKSKRSQAVFEIDAKRRLYLTGTPILNRPIELQPLLASLAPDTWGNFWDYATRYCAATKNKYGWDFSGASNLEELQEKLRATVMVRRLKRDVLTELPAKQRTLIELDHKSTAVINAERAALARNAATLDALRARLEAARATRDRDEDSYRAAVQALRAGQGVAFADMARERLNVARAKLPAAMPYIHDLLEQTQKIVVFAHHHEIIDAIMSECRDAGYNPVSVTGAHNAEQRQAAVDRFQTDPAARIFVGSLAAASVGLTLTAAADVVFLELDWVPATMNQAEDRCHRIGQTDQVNIHHLVLAGSLDADMAARLIAKQDVIDRGLGDQWEVI